MKNSMMNMIKKVMKMRAGISNIALSMIFVLAVLVTNSGPALAAANLNVIANVEGTCYFNSADYTLDFGLLDPSQSADVQASVNVTYWCTNGMMSTLQADMGQNESAGSRQMAGANDSYIPYALSLPAGDVPTLGPGTPVTATINGTILNADYVNKYKGNYIDFVTLTIVAE